MAKIKDNPTVSVIIPTYNRAHMVGRAIQSVLNQTYQDFELIVVDDGSTDNTDEVVKGFDNERPRYIRYKENKGAQVARNTGLKAARGEYIALLDSDDEWLPEKLEKQINKFKSVSNNVGLIYCGKTNINKKTGEILNEIVPTERGDVFKNLINHNFTAGSTPLIKKLCFIKAGYFDTELPAFQDYDLWLRISMHYKFNFVAENLVKVCFHTTQITANVERRLQGAIIIFSKYQKYMPRSVAANKLKYIGMLLAYQGNFKEASRYFKGAINNNRLDMYNYIRFLLCKFAPTIYQARLERIRANSIRRLR